MREARDSRKLFAGLLLGDDIIQIQQKLVEAVERRPFSLLQVVNDAADGAVFCLQVKVDWNG